MSVYRIYVEKKPQFAVEGGAVLSDLQTALRIEGVKAVRIVNRYDAEGLTKEDFEKAIGDYLSFEFSMVMQNREYLFTGGVPDETE